MACSVNPKANSNPSKRLESFKITCQDGAKNFAQGEKGLIELYLNKIRFNFNGKAFNLPYDTIISLYYNKDLKRKFPNVRGSLGPLFWRQNPYVYPGYIGAIIFVSLIGDLIFEWLMKIMEKRYIIAFHYKTDDGEEWMSFIIAKRYFNNLRTSLKYWAHLDFQE
jgi:hypothetical protein